MSAPKDADRNQEATVYLGNLDEKCTDALIWELMLQAGPVANVHLPKDRISQAHQGFGFCEFMTEEDADYACQIMNQIKMWGKPIRVNKASYDKKQLDVGANLFIGGLDPAVDEQTLFDTFSAFGIVSQQAKISRDPTTGESKGYGFISYNDFESSDSAIANMDGQFMMNKPITVQYAFKPDGKGERHGTAAERLLASQAKKHHVTMPGANLPTYDTGYQAAAPAAYPPVAGAPPPPPPGFAPPPPAGMPAYAGQAPMGYYPPQGYPAPVPAGFAQAPPPPPPLRMGFQQPPSA